MLRNMAFKIGSVSFIFALVMVLAMLSNIILGNVLSQEDFGHFHLIRTIILFIAPLAIWGQSIAAARYFSQNDISQFRWGKAFIKIMLVVMVLVILSVIIVHFVYHLSLPYLVSIGFAIFATCGTLFLSNVVRSQQRYSQAILMFSGFRILFFLLLVVIYFYTKLTTASAVFAFIAVIVLMMIFNLIFTFKTVPRGNTDVPNEMHTTGLLLMGIDASVDLFASLDSLVIPKILGLEALGLYAATMVPTQIFKVLNKSSKYVWVPEFGRNGNIRFKKLNAAVALVAAFLVISLAAFAHPILDLLYHGKYNEGVPLFRVLVIVGALRLFYSLGSSVVMGKLGKEALKYHLGFTLFTVALYAFLLVTFLRTFGLMGAGYALVIITIVRVLTTYYVIYLFRNK